MTSFYTPPVVLSTSCGNERQRSDDNSMCSMRKSIIVWLEVKLPLENNVKVISLSKKVLFLIFLRLLTISLGNLFSLLSCSIYLHWIQNNSLNK